MTCTSPVDTLILAFGINSRHLKTRPTALKQLQAALRVAKNKFPGARILTPIVNFSMTLPMKDRLNLQVLNNYISKHCAFIPALPNMYFTTEFDKIHWSRSTAERMFEHWVQYLN